MPSASLKKRLLRLLIFPMMLLFILTGWFSYNAAYHEAEEVYDAQLIHYAKVLSALTDHELQEGDIHNGKLKIDTETSYHHYEHKFAYRVWQNNSLLLYSDNAENFGAPIQESGFSKQLILNNQWRFFVLTDDSIRVEVAESYYVRKDLIKHILGGIFWPQLIILPGLILIVWFGILWGVNPLDKLSSLIHKRNPNDLENIELPFTPVELQPLVDAINHLMQRISIVMEKEKHFSDYAAHELRTPLAALKTQIQVALHTRNQEKSRDLFNQTLPALDRMQHMVQQLLSFVRVQRKDLLCESVYISALIQKYLQEFASQLTHQKLSADIQPNVFLTANPDMLNLLLGNLLHNSLKYSNYNALIEVSLKQQDNDIILTVRDNGIGISPEHRDKIFDSFYRIGESSAEGCGLGLSIVKLIADFHMAKISIYEGIDQTGTSVEVIFPMHPTTLTS